MSRGEIRAVITLDASQFASGIDSATQKIQQLGTKGTQSSKGLASSLQSMGSKLQGIGTQATIAGASLMAVFKPMAGILTNSVKAAIDFESALAGVSKTTGYTGKELEVVGDAIIDMSKRMPQSADAIAGVMEIAAQLGVRGKDNLLKFTETAIRMGDSTNLSAETASTEMARFLNITGSGVGTVDKLGSTIVALGNNTATTEAEIMSMGMRIAAAGRQVGLSDAEILGFSASLSSLGIRAEMGGSAFSKLMVNMEVACQQGGDSLDNFARVAGVSADEFKNKFQTDAKGAIMDFLRGLNDIEKNGGSVINTLDEMGIGEVRLRDTILRAAAGVDQMSENLDLASDAYQENTALVNESENRYRTFASRLEMFKNKVKAVGISIGKSMMPYMEKLLEIGNKVIDWIGNLNPKFLGLVGVIGAVGVALGGLLMAFGLMATGISGGMSAIGGLIGVLGGISAPVVLAIGAIMAFVGSLKYCWDNVDGFKESVTDSFNRIKTVISEVVQGVWSVIQSVWSKIKPFVTTVFQQSMELVGEVFQTALAIVVPIVEAIWSTIQTVWGAIEPFVSTIFGGVLSILQGIWQVIYNLIKGVMQAIRAIMDGDWEAVKQIISNAGKGIWEGIKSIWEGIKQFLVAIWESIKSVASPIWEGIKSFITTICSAIGDVLSGIWEGIKSFLGGIWDSISSLAQSAWESVSNVITSVCQAIWDFISPIWEGIKNVVTTVSDVIRQVIEIAWMIIQNIIENVCTVVGGIVSITWENIKTVTSTIFNAVKDVVTNIWNAIKDFFSPVVNAIKDVVSTAWNAIKSVTSTIFNAIKTFINNVWNGIKIIVTTVVNAIKAVITTVWNAIKSVVTSVMNGIKSTISNIWESIKSTVSNVVNGIKNTVSNVFNSIKDTATSVWNGVKNAITKPIESAKNTVLGIIDKIKGAFSGMKITIPKPKLPHISVGSKDTGILGIKVPTFSVDWYAKGGFFNGASIIGVGEAGKEAVLPLENKRNMKPYAKAVASLMDDMSGVNSGSTNVTIQMNGVTIREEADIKKLSEQLARLIDREKRRKGKDR